MFDQPLPPLPPPDLRFMGEDDQQFIEIANQNATLLTERGLRSDHSILDIGSGYGRLAFGLLSELGFVGRYEGFDILPRHITWCREAISTRFPNFAFKHVDVANARYNPQGSRISSEARFPYEDDTFDYCVLFSVFTHMYSASIRRYIREIKRVLKANGVCIATFFLFNDSRLSMAVSASSDLPMEHRLSSVCRFYSKADVLHAISYEENFVRDLWTSSGLVVNEVKWGSWAEHRVKSALDRVNPVSYQDIFIVKA